MLTFFFFISLSISVIMAENVWKLYKFEMNLFPNARCLDGSAAGLWFLPGYGHGTNKYKIGG
jgi:hypothetical protein